MSGVAGLALSGPAAGAGTGAPAARRPLDRLLIGYGVVTLWHTSDPVRLARSLALAGGTLTEMEYVAWFNDDARKGNSIETRVEPARRFVAAMRQRQITTLISLVNWNGAAQRAQDDGWYKTRVQELKTVVGPEGVILLGVSEPDGQEGGKAYRWMQIAAREWPGLRAANGDYGRGDPRVSDFEYVDWHHCEDFDDQGVRLVTAGAPTINNTDCGPVLNPGPTRAAAMARVALQRRAHFHIYGFRDEAIDEAVIEALGQEIHRSAFHR